MPIIQEAFVTQCRLEQCLLFFINLFTSRPLLRSNLSIFQRLFMKLLDVGSGRLMHQELLCPTPPPPLYLPLSISRSLCLFHWLALAEQQTDCQQQRASTDSTITIKLIPDKELPRTGYRTGHTWKCRETMHTQTDTYARAQITHIQTHT